MATQLVRIGTELSKIRVESLRDQLAQAEQELAEAAVPQEPVGPNRVIRFYKYGGEYPFAAIKVAMSPDGIHGPCKWFVTQDGSRTSRQGHPPKEWNALLQWIGERNWSKIEVLS